MRIEKGLVMLVNDRTERFGRTFGRFWPNRFGRTFGELGRTSPNLKNSYFHENFSILTELFWFDWNLNFPQYLFTKLSNGGRQASAYSHNRSQFCSRNHAWLKVLFFVKPKTEFFSWKWIVTLAPFGTTLNQTKLTRNLPFVTIVKLQSQEVLMSQVSNQHGICNDI